VPTLVLTIAGPLQAWGTGSRFSSRQTELAPSKSGVIGLVAAAQGLRRTEPLTELAGLRFGVRADQPGSVLRDFQTARTDDGSGSSISDRYYLSDAVFLAALQSEDLQWLQRIQGYVRRPVYPLYLGRRSCPPSGPVQSELFDGDIEEAFESVPWKACVSERLLQREYPQVCLETRIDTAAGEVGAMRQKDVPVSFAPERREHRWREVDFGQVWVPNPEFRGSDEPTASGSKLNAIDGVDIHDVFAAIPEGA